MRFKQTIKRMTALGVGASMVGATLFGAMAANLGDYPSQYVKDGKFTGVLVVGDKAAAEDVIGVSDIAVSLQFAATKPVSVSGGGQVVADGEAWRVGTSTKILEMGENAATGANRETIAQIVNFQFIDDVELPNLLKTYTANNPKGDAPYDQRLYFEDNSSGYTLYTEDDEDTTADFLFFPSGSQLARYEMEFTTSLESDVDDSAGSSATDGTFLTDLEDTELEMLGKQFEVVTAKRGSTVGGGVILTMMGGAVRDTLTLGTTKTYTIDGKDYEVTLDFVDSDSAKLTVNGETTRDMVDGDTDKLSDGTNVGISEILFQDFAGGVHSAEFFLGAQKIELRDTDITDSTSSHSLEVDDEDIDDAAVTIEGTDDNSTVKIDKISVNMTADDDFYIPAGGKLSENPELQEPEVLFTKNWDIEYQGLGDEAINLIEITSNGNDDYELEFVDTRGNKAKVPIGNAVAASNLRFGDDDDDLIISENKTISKDDYFLLSDSTDENGDRSSFAMRYRGSDKSTDDDPNLKFDDMGSGERIERPISVGAVTTGCFAGHCGGADYNWTGIKNMTAVALMGTIKLGGATFNVYNASTHTVSDFEIIVDIDGDGSIDSSSSPDNTSLNVDTSFSINTQFGAEVTITNSTDGNVIVEVDTPNTDDYDDLNPSPFIFNISADSSGEVSAAKGSAMVHQFKNPDDEEDNDYTYSSYGALALYTTPSSDPEEVKIWYPQNQRTPNVFVTGKDVSFTATESTSSGGAVSLQRIDVGATKLASEVPNINAVNSILVGGPCANAAAAEVMGNPGDCTAGFEPGVGLLQIWDVGSGNVAMLVAGYAAEDTRNAAQVISNHGDYDLSGEAMEVRRVGSSLTVAEHVEEAHMDDDDSMMEEEGDAMEDEDAEE